MSNTAESNRLVTLGSILFYFAQPPLVVSKYSFATAFFMFIYGLSIFLTSTAFADTNAKIRHTTFEIYRIFENCPLGYDPEASGIFVKRFHSEAISQGEAIFHSPKANFTEKKHAPACFFRSTGNKKDAAAKF